MSGYTFHYIDPDGVSWTLTDQIHSFLKRGGMKGFGVMRVEAAAARRPYRDGVSRLGGPYTPEREMQLALEISHNSGVEWDALNRRLARNVSAYKDPAALGHLSILRPDGERRYIDCWMVEWPDPAMEGPLFGTVMPVFWAERPWFYDPTLSVQTLALPGGGLVFPITFPITFVTTALDGYVYPDNEGDVETWPLIRIDGPGTDPIIDNVTTGLSTALTQTLDAGDYILIDMDAATITFFDLSLGTTTSIIELMGATSTFWSLVRGPNTIRVRMGDAVSGSISFTFQVLYQSL